MRKIALYLSLAFLTFSCGSKNQNANIFENNFENYVDYGFSHDQLKKGESNSGLFSLELTPEKEYGLGFTRTIGELPLNNFKKVKVSAWVKTAQIPSQINLVVQIDGKEKTKFWNAIEADNIIEEENKWTEISGEFSYNGSFSPTDIIKIYVWNKGKITFQVDDLSFEFLK